MSTLSTIKAQIQSLIDTTNATTGKNDTNLTDGVNSLIEKYDLEPVLQEKSVTENGEVVADEGYDGLSKVTVNVPDREVKLQDKTITENGTYVADSGYDGLSKVTVDIASSGGASAKATLSATYGNTMLCGATLEKKEFTANIAMEITA